jgi:hypothetical protein
MLDVFEEILALNCNVLRLEVSVTRGEETESDAEPKLMSYEELDNTLVSLRRTRRTITDKSGEALLSELEARDEDLAARFRDGRAQALRHLGEWEKQLIFFGAGSDDDAKLAEDLIPEPGDVPPGDSIPFDL